VSRVLQKIFNDAREPLIELIGYYGNQKGLAGQDVKCCDVKLDQVLVHWNQCLKTGVSPKIANR
jgi:hypothetical protein